jgi:hypothetical protein
VSITRGRYLTDNKGRYSFCGDISHGPFDHAVMSRSDGSWRKQNQFILPATKVAKDYFSLERDQT